MRVNPNVCPTCLGPLTSLGQCISPDCVMNMLCGICQTKLNVFQQCQNPHCKKYDDTVQISPISPDQAMFLEWTVVGMGVCPFCGTKHEVSVSTCQYCGQLMPFQTVTPERSTFPPSGMDPTNFARSVSGFIRRPKVPVIEALDLDWDDVLSPGELKRQAR